MANEIVISTSETQMRSMLIKLMGRGLLLSQAKTGHYKLGLDDLLDLISKIAQRVKYQNHCEMSDFHCSFQFEDGSMETVPSFDHLEKYRSLNSNICTGARFSFAFLIDFHSRGVEKQSIDIEIKNRGAGSTGFFSSFFDDDFQPGRLGTMSIRIEYTDITWANDIKNLFEKYTEVHIESFAWRASLMKFFGMRGLVLFTFPLLMFVSVWRELVKANGERIGSSLKLHLSDVDPADQLSVINKKLDFLIYGEHSKILLQEALFPVAVIAAAILSFYLVSMLIKNIPISAMLLSSEADKVYSRIEKARSKVNGLAVSGIVLSIIVSIISANLDRLLISTFH